MANHTITLEIITPDACAFKEDIDFLLVRALDGYVGIYANHEPMMAALDMWPIKIKQGEEERYIAIFDGFVDVRPDKITILTDHCEMADHIDGKRAEAAKERAVARLRHPEDIDMVRAEAALLRSLTRLRTVGALSMTERFEWRG